MIDILGPTVSGGYNVVGVEDDVFIIQGNLTTDQLKELKEVIEKVLDGNDD